MASEYIGVKAQTKEKTIQSEELKDSLKKDIDVSVISNIKTQESNIKNMDTKDTKKSSSFIVPQTNSIKEDDERLDNTEVYDEGDLASAYERGFIQDALNRHKEKLAPETHPDFDGETCIDCGAEIPALRLSMGRIRCVDCQNKLEKRKKLYA